MMKKIAFTYLFFLVNIIALYSQTYSNLEQPDHLSFHITPSITLLDYKSARSRSIPGVNAGAGVEYAHFFNKYLGLSIGAEVNSFSSYYSFGNKKDSLPMFDSWSGFKYTLHQNLNSLEYQRVTYLNVPLKIELRNLVARNLRFTSSFGVAYSLYLTEHQSVVARTVDRSAYFDSIHVLVDDFAPLNFGKFTHFINPSGKQQFKRTFMGLFQLGLAYTIIPDVNLHAELNIQYGFENIKLLDNNILVPEEYSGVTATNYIGTIRPMSIGIRVGVTYNFDLFGIDCKCHQAKYDKQ
jgi:hypothetical protein